MQRGPRREWGSWTKECRRACEKAPEARGARFEVPAWAGQSPFPEQMGRSARKGPREQGRGTEAGMAYERTLRTRNTNERIPAVMPPFFMQ